MSNKVKLFLIFIVIIFCISYIQLPAAASNTDLPTVKVAMSDDQSITVDRILHEALDRAGYRMTPEVTGMRTAIADVNYGDATILALQIDGWDKTYKNLIKIPIAIGIVELTAYARSADSYCVSQWDDLAGLRLGYRWQNEYVTDNIQQAGASALFEANGIDELWDTLLNNKTDVVILPRMENYENRLPKGISKVGVIDRQPCYTYVHKSFAYLVRIIENVYLEMIADGTIDAIQAGRKLDDDKKIILHINSYNTQIEWERSQLESIRRSLELENVVEYRSIDLNTNESHSQTSFNAIVSDLIRTDFIERYPDLIIASGNEALEFVLANYYSLFPNTSVVFFGVHKFDGSMLDGLEEHVTGVAETVTIHNGVEEILRIIPNANRVFILNDYTLTKSIKLREEIQKSTDVCGLPVEYIFNEDKPLTEILSDIRELGPDTPVLIGNYLSDSSGALYSEVDVQRLVAAASRSPVFSMLAPYIGHGTVGGLVPATEMQTKIVAAMVTEILNGTPPSDIPIISDSEYINQWYFDYEALGRFKIDTSTLPTGHTIINRSLPIWESNPLEFRLVLAVAVLLLLIICGLIVFLKVLSKKQIAAKMASVTKSAFLANMSHEIRTPLNAIIGLTSIGMSVTDPERLKYCFTKIEDASKHLLGVINDILDMSKIESGKVELSVLEFDFEIMLRQVVSVVNFRVDEKKHKLEVHIDKRIPKNLFGDDQRLAQVITNLLSNAVKFTPEGGVISLETMLLSEENDVCEIQISVTDTGIGISPEQQARLFRSFQQADTDTTRKYGGTGLGLAISKSIVEMMGGKIWVSSESEKGSTFAFTIKAKRGTDKTHGVLDPKINVNNMRVLMVDDDPDILDYFEDIMHELGISCDVSANGKEALELVRRNGSYDIYFIDWRMPGIDGVQFTEQLSKATSTPDNSVVVMISAAELNTIETQARQAGVDKFISKPIFPSMLVDLINECLGSSMKHVEDELQNNNDVFSGYRILLAEDVEINREIVMSLLEPTGLVIDCARNGTEAVEMFSKRPEDYGMIFMDVQMPEMDGYEATRSIRALDSEYAGTIPIIAMTANVFREDIEKCLESGMDGHVGKPLDINDVIQQLKVHLLKG